MIKTKYLCLDCDHSEAEASEALRHWATAHPGSELRPKKATLVIGHTPDWQPVMRKGYFYWRDVNQPADFDGTWGDWRGVLESNGILPPLPDPEVDPNAVPGPPTPPVSLDPTASHERLATPTRPANPSSPPSG